MHNLDLAGRYRPRKFEDVVGQKRPVQYLSALIKQGQIGQNLLLHGSVGSGKTSLVRLYAKAMNCEVPSVLGSPCGLCSSCLRIDKSGIDEYDVSGQGGGKTYVLNWTEPRNRPHTFYRHRILFFDEAHSLENEAADALLKMVEEPAESVHFCFATTEMGAMRRALLSRLHQLEVRPLSVEDAVKLMRHIADQEGILYHVPALKLLAGLKDCYPRDLLNGLAQVYGPEKRLVSLENVRKEFDADHPERLLCYCEALAEGDVDQQTQLFCDWQESGARKVGWVQAFLTSLYYNDIVCLEAVIDSLTYSIESVDRASILDRFCQRFNVLSRRDLAPFWRSMMAFWPILETPLDDIAVMMRLTLFHDLVNEELPRRALEDCVPAHPHGWQDCERQVTKDVSFTPTASSSALTLSISSRDRSETGSRYLILSDARQIINGASFLVQAHELRFNACFEVWPQLFGTSVEPDDVALISQFCEELEQKVRGWGRGDQFAGMTLLRRSRQGPCGVVLTHLPRAPLKRSGQQIDCLEMVEGWYRNWLWERRTASREEAVTCRSEKGRGQVGWTFHWKQTLDLCTGISPELERFDPEQGRDRPLLELLGIQERQSGPFDVPLVRTHGLLQPDAVAAANIYGMQPLFAFDANEWGWIRKEWELREFRSRHKERQRRKADLKAIDLQFGIDTPEARFETSRIESTWPARPEDRQRSWTGWWCKQEV